MSEANARKVMQIFRMYRVEADTMLLAGSIMVTAPKVGLAYEDIEAAINEAIARGWLRHGENQMLFLTQAGSQVT